MLRHHRGLRTGAAGLPAELQVQRHRNLFVEEAPERAFRGIDVANQLLWPASSRQDLRRGLEDDHHVFLPRRLAFGRAAPTPDIHDLFTAPVRSDGGAYLATFGEVALEL